MVHYGLQYQELLRKTADEVALAKCKANDAKAKYDRLVAERMKASELLEQAKDALESARTAFLDLTNADVVKAVETYRVEKGRYPI